jgi:hypothetical protein
LAETLATWATGRRFQASLSLVSAVCSTNLYQPTLFLLPLLWDLA